MRLHFLVTLLLLAFVWPNQVRGQGITVDRLISKGSTDVPFVFGRHTFPAWSRGALLVVQDRFSSGPIFRVVERDGREISQFRFQIPGASRINIYDNSIARGSDGSIAVIGSAYSSDLQGGTFLAWISPDGREQVVVRLSPFAPNTVTVAADGAIWVAGYDTKQDASQRDYEQHLIRRYDKSGKLLGSFLPWSAVKPATRTLPAALNSILVSSTDRVGWFSRFSQTYIEFSLDGSVLTKIRTPEHHQDAMLTAALCDGGTLFLSAAVNSAPQRPGSWGIFVLDPHTQTWNFIRRKETFGRLYGCDGTRLATTTDHKAITWLEATGK